MLPNKIFGALPYPEWRIELVKRAQKAGLGDIGRAVEALRYGASSMRPSHIFLDQLQTARPGGSSMTEDSDSISGTSALTERPNRSLRSHNTKSASDDEHDKASYMLEISDSDDESSEAEWQAWMADLHRQVEVRSRKQHSPSVTSLETSIVPQIDDEIEDKPPKTLEDDLLLAINRRRKLEPSGIVITSSPSSPAFSSARVFFSKHSSTTIELRQFTASCNKPHASPVCVDARRTVAF
ncbi:hypothetical protein BDQ17DRAFT_194703 [Cyathus striatus]|nr:hypothetical protein BDQ17DRAFT_194703 [Cyathus striatus]